MIKSWNNFDFSEIDSPALIIDKKKVIHNIDLAIQYAGGAKNLRPHVKTHKMLDIAKLQMAAGIQKFKCSTIAEAEMLGMAEAKNVLIAYPVQGPKIERVQTLINSFPKTRFSVLIDNFKTASTLNQKFKPFGSSIEVFIDVNVGQNRTGIQFEQLKHLVEQSEQLLHVQLKGFHCYDGHIHMSSLEERTKICRHTFEEIFSYRKQVQLDFGRDLIIIAGGSPTFPVHAKWHDVECSPGTFIFWDQGYANNYPEQQFKKAAVVATRVISKIDAHTYCLDLGHKSIASEFPFPRIEIIHSEKFTQIGHSEEHLVIKSEKPDVLEAGQLLLAYPFHICPTVALYNMAHIVNHSTNIEKWQITARNRKITI